MGATATIDASGSGPVSFTNGAAVAFSSSLSRTLTLTGTSTADNRFGPTIIDWVSPTTVIKEGPGTWHLTTQSGFSGPLIVNAGILQLAGNATQYVSGTTTVNAGATVAVDPGTTDHIRYVVLNGGTLTSGTAHPTWGTFCFDSGIAATGGVTSTISAVAMTGNVSTIPVTIDAGSTLNISGGFGWNSYNPALTFSGSGLAILSGSNSTTGLVTIAGGTLQIGNGGTTGSINTTSYVDNSVLAVNRSDTVTLSTVVSGTGILSKAGTNTLIITAANTYSGGTVVNGGTLQLGNGSVAGSLGVGPITNNAVLAFNTGTNTVSLSGGIGGTGWVLFNSPGTVALAAAGSYTGGSTINAGGTVQIASTSSFGAASSPVTFAGSGGTVQLAPGFGSGTASRPYNLNASATFDTNGAGNTLALTGTITGSAALTKKGAGTLALNGVNSLTGPISINGGALALDSATLGANTVSVAAGGKLNATGTSSIGGVVTVAGNGGSLSSNGAIDLTGGSGLNTLSFTGSGTVLTVGGSQAGQYSLLNVNVGPGNSASFLDLGSATLQVNTGGLSVNPNALPGATTGSATIVSAGNITNYSAITTPVIYGQTAGAFALATSATNVILNWTLGSNPDVVYWNGGLSNGLGSVWFVASGSTNWTGDAAGLTAALVPGANSEIHLSSTNAANLSSQSLGANGTVKSIIFDSTNTGSVSVVDSISSLQLASSGTAIYVNNPGQSLTLAVALTGSGATVIDSGTLQIGNGGVAGGLPTGPISGASGALVYYANGNATLPSIDGGVQLVQKGSGILTLSSSNSYTGGTTVNSGGLQLGDSHALGANGPLTVNAGTIDLNGTSPAIGSLSGGSGAVVTSNTAGNSTLSVTQTTAATFAGAIRNGLGTLALSVAGSGTLALTGSNNYSGGTQVNAGATLAFNTDSALGTDAGTVTLNGGTLVQTANFSFKHSIDTGTVGGAIVLTNQSLQFNSYSSGTNAILGSGPLVVSATNGHFTLSSRYNTGYTGDWTFNGGIIEIQDGGSASIGSGNVTLGPDTTFTIAWGQPITNPISANGGAISFNNGDGSLISGPVTLNAPTRIALYDFYNTGAGRSATISGVLSGTGGITVAGPTAGTATLTVTGANSYSGPTVIDRGVLSIVSLNYGYGTSPIGAADPSAANLVFQNNGTLRYTGPNTVTDRLFSLGSGGGTIDASGTGPVQFSNYGALDFNGQTGTRTLTLTGSGAGANVLNAAIGDNSGATSVVKSGPGTWVLNGSSTYTGATTVSSGTLAVSQLADAGSPSSIGAASSSAANLVLNAVTLEYNGTGSSSNRLFTLGTGTTTIVNAGNGPLDLTNSGDIASSGSGARTVVLTGSSTSSLAARLHNSGGTTSVIKNGPGTWTLAGQSDFTGGMTVNSGVLQVMQDAALGAVSGPVVLKNSTTLQTGTSFAFDAARTFTLTGTVTFDTQDNTNTVNSVLSGSTATLVKAGSGALVLAGDANLARINAGAGTVALNHSIVLPSLNVGTSGTVSLTAHSGSTPTVLDTSALTFSDATGSLGAFADASGLGSFLENGDAIVDGSNYGYMDYCFQSTLASGDLNGDGIVDASDYGLLDHGVQTPVYGVLNESASAVAQAAPSSPSAVPEPGAFGLLLAGAAGLLGIRRGRSRKG